MAIAKMIKIFMVGASAHKAETMRFLQKAGVLHLEPVVPLAGDCEKEASSALLKLRHLSQIEEAVGRYKDHEKRVAVDCPDELLVVYVEECLASLQETRSRRQILGRMVEDLAPWGDFDPDAAPRLAEKGVHLQRWRMERKKKTDLDLPDDVFVEVVSEKKELLLYTVSLTAPLAIPGATSLPLPEMRLADAIRESKRLEADEEKLSARLAGAALLSHVLKEQMTEALNEASYLVQIGTLHSEEYLFGLQGWIPDDMFPGFLRTVEEGGMPLLVETREPLADEEPPVLLRNNWFIRRIEPLLKLYGTPCYRDLDPSYFFAPFMVLFFGVCLSDAGYGLVFYIAAHLTGRRWGGRVDGLPLVVKLCKAFAVSAVVIGLLTGSVFGYNFDDRNWILIDVSVDAGNPMLFFYLAMGLGVVHLSCSYVLGMVQDAYRYLRLQKLGLLFVLWGGVMLVAKSIWFSSPSAALHAPLVYGGWGLLALGVLLTLLFASNHRHWGVRIGIGIWNVYGLTGLIGDLLSYARLFGLGIGTAAIASVMNKLAILVLTAAGPVFGVPLAVFIIIIGHIFNLALSLLGSTVHSARLHFVEAFKSFFAGGGIAYKPFKIERGSS